MEFRVKNILLSRNCLSQVGPEGTDYLFKNGVFVWLTWGEPQQWMFYVEVGEAGAMLHVSTCRNKQFFWNITGGVGMGGVGG